MSSSSAGVHPRPVRCDVHAAEPDVPPPAVPTRVHEILLDLTDWIAVASLVSLAIFAGATASQRVVTLARLTVPALILAGPFYSWSFANFSRVEFPAQGRFGQPLFALIVVAVAASLRTRSATMVVGAIAGVSLLNTAFLVLAL